MQPKSSVKYEITGTKKPIFCVQHVPKLKNLLKKPLPYWKEILLTSFFILTYYGFSIGLNKYEQWTFMNAWPFPLHIIICHLFVKFLLSWILRRILECYKGQKRVRLSKQNIMLIAPLGIGTGFFRGFTEWALNLTTTSLYFITKSMTIISTLEFALLFGLERKSWSLRGIFLMITFGFTMFVYRSPRLHVLGIFISLLASFFNGFRWTTEQHIMQKSNLRLKSPIDMMYFTQPWVLLAIIPFAVCFEGNVLYYVMSMTDWTDSRALLFTFITIFGSGLIGFCQEFTQLTIISRASGLTLCVSELFKVVSRLLLTPQYGGMLMSDLNFMGLLTFWSGIIMYIILKLWMNTETEEKKDLEANSKTNIYTISDISDEKQQLCQLVD